MLLKIRNFVCFPIGFIGAMMWNSAFKKGTQDNYDNLTFLEKMGYNMMAWYVIKGKFNKKQKKQILISS